MGSWKIIEILRPLTAADRLLVEAEQVVAVEPDRRAAHLARRRGHETEHGERAHRLAAARLADHGNDLAGIDPIGDAADRLEPSGRHAEGNFEILDFQQPGHDTAYRRLGWARRSCKSLASPLALPRCGPCTDCGRDVPFLVLR